MISSGGMADELADDFRRRIRLPASWVCVLAVLLVHGWSQLEVAGDGGMGWYGLFGLSRAGVVDGRYWQIFSHGFLHGSWVHLGMNALLMWLLGTRLELMAGWRVMLGVVFSGVIAGGAMHLVLGHGMLVGISGGVMALLLCVASLSPDATVFPLGLSARNLGRGVLIGEVLMTLSDPALGFPGVSRIGTWFVDRDLASVYQLGHACHVGGGLVGMWWARKIYGPRLSLKKLRLDRERRERAEGG